MLSIYHHTLQVSSFIVLDENSWQRHSCRFTRKQWQKLFQSINENVDLQESWSVQIENVHHLRSMNNLGISQVVLDWNKVLGKFDLMVALDGRLGHKTIIE